VCRLSRKCGSLDVSQPYGPPRPVTGIASPFLSAVQDSNTLFHIRETAVQISARRPAILRHFAAFINRLQINPGTVPQIRPHSFLSTSCMIHHPFIIQPLEATVVKYIRNNQIRSIEIPLFSRISSKTCLKLRHTLSKQPLCSTKSRGSNLR
jgi:hypothetical protein